MNKSFWSVCLAISVAAVAGLSGCEVGPNYQEPHLPTPGAFSEASTRPASRPVEPQLAEVPTAEELERWWTTFHDPELDSLITRAAASNLDLQAAVERIHEARAQLGIATAGLFPTANAIGDYTHSRRSNRLGGSSFKGAILESDLYQAGFDASWELDLFGGIRRGEEAARASYQAAVEGQREVLITLLGEVATDYIQLRGVQRQIDIANQNIKTQKQSLALIQSRNRAGLVADLDVTQQEAQVMTTTAALPDLEAQVHVTIHQLSVLLDLPPGALQSELETTRPIPFGPYQIPPGLPSELLRRRPDIRQAERQLAAASAEIGVATAQLYPQISLTGNFGYESSQFHNLFNLYSRYFGFGPSITWPIFNAGSIQYNIEVQNSLERQAFITYESTVLTSFEEVEDALIAYTKEQDRRAALEEAVKADQRSVEMTQDLYKNGLDTFLDVLTAQNTLLIGQLSLAQSEELVSSDLVALYKALGGGWQPPEVQPATQPSN